MEKILNVLYQSDNNYAEITGVSIVSLLENNKHLSDINIYLLNDNISEENISRMKSVCDKYNRNLIVVDTESILQKLKELKVEPYKNTYTTYFKLFAIKSLNIPTDRVLQLDGDTVINHPLDELLEMDLTDCVCAATYDCILNEYKTLVDVPENDKYYNCGVLLINQKYWRENQCEEKITHHLLNVRNRYFTVDQDIINVLFRSKIKYLHLKYNFNSGFYIYGIKESIKIYNLKPEYYSDIKLIEEAYKDPIIYHCMGAMTGRPWEQNNIHPQNAIYDKYLALSPWKDMPKKIVNYSTIFKVQRLLYKILPRSLYSPLHRIALKRFLRQMNDSALSR
ncbi:MAG: glycosyltransferase family 8 protein [Coprobacillaceae bacterium]